MRYVVFSDVHGNLEAFKSAIGAIKGERASRFFCVGDIVGYGADPASCIALTRKLDPVTVCGNHDWASVDLASIEYFNDYAKRAAIWTQSVLNEKEKDYLKLLPLTYADDDITMVHGTLMRPEFFDYVLDFNTAYQMMRMMSTRVAFIGHSHVPGIFSMEGEDVRYDPGPAAKISPGKKYIINAGSVGQPRDGDPRASYCVYDREGGTVEIKRVAYDVAAAKKKILKARLPAYLAERLDEGR